MFGVLIFLVWVFFIYLFIIAPNLEPWIPSPEPEEEDRKKKKPAKPKRLDEETIEKFIEGFAGPADIEGIVGKVYKNHLGIPTIRSYDLKEVDDKFGHDALDLATATAPQHRVLNRLRRDYTLPINYRLDDYRPLLSCYLLLRTLPENVEPSTEAIQQEVYNEEVERWKEMWFTKWMQRWKDQIPEKYREEINALYQKETGRREEEWVASIQK
jgi:hypothetical protein